MTRTIRGLIVLFFVYSAALFTVTPAHSRGVVAELGGMISANAHSGSYTAPAGREVEVGFSPNEGAEELVLKVIGSARSQIRMMAYSFTSASVVNALIAAKHRNPQLDIQIVVDYKNNVTEDERGKARAAMNAIVNAGIALRTIRVYPIHHDKVLIIDQAHVQTGSFNYSAAAASRYSENVLVNWNSPELARVYLTHWLRNFRQGVDYRSGY